MGSKLTTMYTGKNKNISTDVENVPDECAVPFNSFKITRRALKTILAMARAVHDHVGSIECYCLLLSNRPDFTITDIAIPVHSGTGASVVVSPEAITEVRDFIKDMNEQINNPEEKWKVVGWSHSHNTMSVFFSGTDWDNQKMLLDAAGIITKHFGQTVTVIYGMTVNVKGEVYAEVLNRMKCGAETRIEGAILKVEEEVDADYKELYSIIKEEVIEKITTARGIKKFKTGTIFDYVPQKIDKTEYISDEDLVDEMYKKLRPTKEIMIKAWPGLKLKKRLEVTNYLGNEESVEKVLYDLVYKCKGIILKDVEHIILGKELEPIKPKTKNGEKLKKYEQVVDSVKASTDKRDFKSMNEFIKFLHDKLPSGHHRYLKKSRSFMRDKLEEDGFTFTSTPTGKKKGEKKNIESINNYDPEDVMAIKHALDEIPKINNNIKNTVVHYIRYNSIKSLSEMPTKDVKKLFKCSLNQANLIISAAKRCYYKNKHDEKKHANQNDVDYLILSLTSKKKSFIQSLSMLDSTTKDMVVRYLQNNSIKTLSEMTSKDVERSFGCISYYASLIIDVAQRYYKHDTSNKISYIS